MRKFDYDVAVLGGGSAGYAAARTAAGEGLKTVVIEGGSEVGGLCILRGCMPSKALLYSAEVMHLVRHAGAWGIRTKEATLDFPAVMARKARLISSFADYRRGQLENGKFDFLRAHANFIDQHSLKLNLLPDVASQPSRQRRPSATPKLEATERILTARHFVIATGSVVAAPPLPSLTEIGYITSDEALSLERLPKSLIVLGGGAIACELAQCFTRFGVKVTMIQRSPHVLREFDEDAAGVIETVLRRDDVKLLTATKLLDAWRSGRHKGVTFSHAGKKLRVQAEEILLTLGRTPNTASLGLEHAGVTLDQGRITTNTRMQTSAPHIFAAGDCTGPHEIVHIAIQQAEIAAKNIAHPRRQHVMDYRLLTNVVFTDPQVATVGLTEKAAAGRQIPFLAASYPFNDHGKSLIMEALDGFVKLLANPKTGEILGGACVGPLGGELIHEIVAAMAKRMTVQELAVMPHYHPTLAEIWTYPAEELAERIKPQKAKPKSRTAGL